MPKILPAPQRLNALVEVIHAAHAHRVVVGFLVAREAGVTHQHSLSPIGNELMSRWVRSRNLPRMIKDSSHTPS
jgi:hypothetical protein